MSTSRTLLNSPLSTFLKVWVPARHEEEATIQPLSSIFSPFWVNATIFNLSLVLMHSSRNSRASLI